MRLKPLIPLALLAPLAFAAERPVDSRTMRVAIGEWPPFVSENLEHYGLAARIVTEAFAAVGNDVRYRFYPWKRAYLETTQGDQDATAIWTKTPDREGEVLFSNPVLTADKVFFHLERLRLVLDGGSRGLYGRRDPRLRLWRRVR